MAKDPQRQLAAKRRWANNAPDRAAAALNDWVEQWAPKLEAFAPNEAAAVGHIAAAIDQRIAAKQSAPTPAQYAALRSLLPEPAENGGDG